jgi:hypothetical protein
VVELSLVVAAMEQSLFVAVVELSLVVVIADLAAIVVAVTQVIAIVVAVTKVIAVVVAVTKVDALVVAAKDVTAVVVMSPNWKFQSLPRQTQCLACTIGQQPKFFPSFHSPFSLESSLLLRWSVFTLSTSTIAYPFGIG